MNLENNKVKFQQFNKGFQLGNQSDQVNTVQLRLISRTGRSSNSDQEKMML